MNFSRISKLSFSAAITAILLVGRACGLRKEQDPFLSEEQEERQAQEVPFDDEIIYYDEPVQKWTVQLPFTGEAIGNKVGNGNAVSISPDNLLVYITLDNGRLEVLLPSDGARHGGYLPSQLFPNWSASCVSGVAFGQLNSMRFVIHTVIHMPPFPVSLEQDVQS